MSLIVKICGITQPEQGRAIAKAGATMVGFICVPESPRYIAPNQIASIVNRLPTDLQTGQIMTDRVGVFVNASLEVIRNTIAIANLNGVQLHGNESPEFCRQLKQQLPTIKLIKALRVQSAATLQSTNLYHSCVDMLLLDAYHPTMAGGTGTTLDWQSLQTFNPPIPWLLAGGLTPDNVLDALNQTRPTGIDLSSGVEQARGIKDLQKVAQLFAAVRDYQIPHQ